MFNHPTSAAAPNHHVTSHNNKPQPNPANSSKMSEVERIKQELLGYQREIELMQKQREYAKLVKQQQKQQQLEQTGKQQQPGRKQAEGNLIL
jgi:hypothetical protein